MDEPATSDHAVIALLHAMRATLANLADTAERTEMKLDVLLESLAQEEEDEAAQRTLDGDVIGAEREQDQPL